MFSGTATILYLYLYNEEKSKTSSNVFIYRSLVEIFKLYFLIKWNITFQTTPIETSLNDNSTCYRLLKKNKTNKTWVAETMFIPILYQFSIWINLWKYWGNIRIILFGWWEKCQFSTTEDCFGRYGDVHISNCADIFRLFFLNIQSVIADILGLESRKWRKYN